MADLGISVNDGIKSADRFGMGKNPGNPGIAGTMHVTSEEQGDAILKSAYALSKSTGKPVVIVVKV